MHTKLPARCSIAAICLQLYTNIHDITEVIQTNINLPVGYERNVDWFVIVVICAPDEVISVSYWRIWNVWYNGVKTYMKSHWNFSTPGFHLYISHENVGVQVNIFQKVSLPMHQRIWAKILHGSSYCCVEKSVKAFHKMVNQGNFWSY